MANSPFVNKVLHGRVACDIGHIDGPTKRELDKLVKAGELAKWRGHWFPTPGAPWGIGPLKTCYGLPAIRDYYESARVSA